MAYSSDNDYDVIICGAGPAGCTVALALRDKGLKVAILEKKEFPRDKVCGDAIPARAMEVLRKINPLYAERFAAYDKQLLTKHTDVVYGKKTLNLHWQIPAYTCARLDFDNHLFSLVKEYTKTSIYQDTRIKNVIKISSGYTVSDTSGNEYKGRIVIGADGAQSVIAKQLGGYKLDREHHIGSVRAYYKNVDGMTTDKTEMFMDKSFQPGYFWLFPIAGGYTNVGFGMMSVDIAERNIDLKKAFFDFIDTVPELKERFANAEMVGRLDGHSLPLGSKRVLMSGDNFMLCGDAASLIDPITGEGIGNAMESGYWAALQVANCFDINDFSATNMKKYDDAVWTALGQELGFRTRAQKLFRRAPVVLDIAFAIAGWEPIRKMIQDKF